MTENLSEADKSRIDSLILLLQLSISPHIYRGLRRANMLPRRFSDLERRLRLTTEKHAARKAGPILYMNFEWRSKN